MLKPEHIDYKSKKDTPEGFLFSTAEAAIKKPGRKDIALIYSRKEAVLVGMFTTNKVKAAPVKLDMKRIISGKGQAIIVNSGNANACTGKKGLDDAKEMTELIARGLNIKSSLVYVASTGVIGVPMPMGRIRQTIPSLIGGIGKASLEDVARAIMTTDTFPKIISKKIKIGKSICTISGICKGAGMICPDMATMLCFILSDISINKIALSKALKESVELSFNRLTIDGDMSTNDTVLAMANGMAKNSQVLYGSNEYARFSKTLIQLTDEMARMIAYDGEGATKFVEVSVREAASVAEAKKAALAIANSNLVKTAIFGNDANWGRIMAALGYSGIKMREDKVDIFFNNVQVVRNGIASGNDKEAGEELRKKEIKITIKLKNGKALANVYTCDLTGDYIKINAEYRT
ncbi:MAG: bifunctional glutamate N-acetyltransferase/amino-acid acetyltransferase ArgJ [Nitrospirae bacterium]|nr:bifunctional glutamate N-acetyltransferase/amino-acid acetyltransferase ArgJ [Nitrospirota bacterium]